MLIDFTLALITTLQLGILSFVLLPQDKSIVQQQNTSQPRIQYPWIPDTCHVMHSFLNYIYQSSQLANIL